MPENGLCDIDIENILVLVSCIAAALLELAGILNPVVTVPMNYHPKYFQIDVKLCKLNQ